MSTSGVKEDDETGKEDESELQTPEHSKQTSDSSVKGDDASVTMLDRQRTDSRDADVSVSNFILTRQYQFCGAA